MKNFVFITQDIETHCLGDESRVHPKSTYSPLNRTRECLQHNTQTEYSTSGQNADRHRSICRDQHPHSSGIIFQYVCQIGTQTNMIDAFDVFVLSNKCTGHLYMLILSAGHTDRILNKRRSYRQTQHPIVVTKVLIALGDNAAHQFQTLTDIIDYIHPVV